ncbi:MAG TPA: hypothetical protein VL021_05360 [Brumimicrobium sp.]|nr:hypothetical protein [Brumimicrobium sp.]
MKTKELVGNTPQVIPQVKKLVLAISGEMRREEIQDVLNLSDKRNYMNNYQKDAIELKLIEMTIPEKPNSSLQKCRLTERGKRLKHTLTQH